jgi:hypothetical protein
MSDEKMIPITVEEADLLKKVRVYLLKYSGYICCHTMNYLRIKTGGLDSDYEEFSIRAPNVYNNLKNKCAVEVPYEYALKPMCPDSCSRGSIETRPVRIKLRVDFVDKMLATLIYL